MSFSADDTGVSIIHNNPVKVIVKVIAVKWKKQVGKLTSADISQSICP